MTRVTSALTARGRTSETHLATPEEVPRMATHTAETQADITRRLLSEPVPTISVWPEYATFANRGRAQAYEDVREGRVQIVRLGRSVRVLVPPLLRQFGFEAPAVSPVPVKR